MNSKSHIELREQVLRVTAGDTITFQVNRNDNIEVITVENIFLLLLLFLLVYSFLLLLLNSDSTL